MRSAKNTLTLKTAGQGKGAAHGTKAGEKVSVDRADKVLTYPRISDIIIILLLPQLILEFSACPAAEILRQKPLPCDGKAAAFFLVSQQQSCA